MMLRTTILLAATLTQAVRIDDDREEDFTNRLQPQGQPIAQQADVAEASQAHQKQAPGIDSELGHRQMEAEEHAKLMVMDAHSSAKRTVEAVQAEAAKKVAANVAAFGAHTTQNDAVWAAKVDEAQKQAAAKLAAATACSTATLKNARDEARVKVAFAKEDALQKTKVVDLQQNNRVACAQKAFADRVECIDTKARAGILSDPSCQQAVSCKVNKLQTASDQSRQRMLTAEQQSAHIIEEAARIKAAKVSQTMADASKQIASMEQKASFDISMATNAANIQVSHTNKEASDAVAQAEASMHAKIEDNRIKIWKSDTEAARLSNEHLKAAAERNSQALQQNGQHIHEIQEEGLKVQEKKKKDIEEALPTANRVHKVEEAKTSADNSIVQIKDTANKEILSHDQQVSLAWIGRQKLATAEISNIKAAVDTTVTKLQADAEAKISSEFKDVAATEAAQKEYTRQAVERKDLHQADAEFRVRHMNSNSEHKMSSMETATKNGIDSMKFKALSQVDAHNTELLALRDHELKELKDAAAEKMAFLVAEANVAAEKKTSIEQQALEQEKSQADKKATVEAKTFQFIHEASVHQRSADETAKQVKAVLEYAEQEKATAVHLQQSAIDRAHLASVTAGAAEAQAEAAETAKQAIG